MEEQTFQQLAIRAQAGDSASLARLLDSLRGALFARAYAELRHYEDAQDAVASAILRIIRRLPALRNPGRVRAWALMIARNEARRIRAGRLPAAPPEGAEAPGRLHDEPATPLRLDVARLLGRLPPDEAHALALFYWESRSVRDIAGFLGRPEGTVKYWLHRGRAYLHASLEGYGPMDNTQGEMTPQARAAIVSSDLPESLVGRMIAAMRAAGWGDVRRTAAPSPVVRAVDGSPLLSPILAGCRAVILDETVAGRSAFEWLLLFRATAEGRTVPVLLLMGGERNEAARNDTVLAAYLAGFDMCLTKPFDLAEFERFAAHLRQAPPPSPSPAPVEMAAPSPG